MAKFAGGAMRSKASQYTVVRALICVAGWRCAFVFFSGVVSSKTGASQKIFQPPPDKPAMEREGCPSSCSDLFSKLPEAPENGRGRSLKLDVHERGEPKSGTGFMFEMASSAVAHGCMFLQRAYGEASCRIVMTRFNRTMIFEPSLAVDSPGSCTCDDVHMVVINLSSRLKHTLPVNEECGYSHTAGILKLQNEPCRLRNGAPPQNYEDVLACARDSACQIMDDSHQMSVMRDPRAIAVSAYFENARNHPKLVKDLSLDEYVLRYLVTACKWINLRHYLFGEVMGDKASMFWYTDAKENPEDWHTLFYEFIGLRLPDKVVTRAVDVAVGRVTDDRLRLFHVKGFDPHVGGLEAVPQRTYVDEVSPETLIRMNELLRVWLPPFLQHKVGIA